MIDGDIDFSSYSKLELEEALSGINRKKYPKNFENLSSAFQRLTGTLPEAQPEPAKGASATDESWSGPKFDEDGRYIPNHASPRERTVHIFLSMSLLAYGGYGLWANDLYVPVKRSNGLHMQGAPAWIMYGAMICACVVLLSLVVDHYDRRNNERHYRTFAKVFEYIGWSLFGASLIMETFYRA